MTNESIRSSPSSHPSSAHTASVSPSVSVSPFTSFLSNSTGITTSFTTPQCHCQCNRGICIFNMTLGRCQCQCQESIYGDSCSFGNNEISPSVDTGAIPTRKAKITLTISVTFEEEFYDLSSPQSQAFILTLTNELEPLCKEADAQNFKSLRVIKLSRFLFISYTFFL
ncbi:mucin-17-like [Thalassophryne amazonica]|uniref:mucin-17-like n=1 Tax=Thalassophryne amazonica TaxID=390379 RepID=UPI001470DFB9|nr:mucin-17-like [Thalassophryne amazonica]